LLVWKNNHGNSDAAWPAGGIRIAEPKDSLAYVMRKTELPSISPLFDDNALPTISFHHTWFSVISTSKVSTNY
jgi:hypothetical protein